MDSRTKFGRLLVPNVLAHDHGLDQDDDGGVGDHDDDDSDDVDSGDDDDDNSDDLVCEPPLPPSAQVLRKVCLRIKDQDRAFWRTHGHVGVTHHYGWLPLLQQLKILKKSSARYYMFAFPRSCVSTPCGWYGMLCVW